MKNNDARLIDRILDGDDAAFAELVEKYQKQVHALVWRKIGDFHIAEEITQDTFLKAYQKLETLKKSQSFASWLYVIATSLCNTWLRKRYRRAQLMQDKEIAQSEKTTYSEYILSENERITAETQRDVVKKLFAKLGERERTVMTLHYFGEMSCTEIGAFLGVSANTVKSRLRRAQQRLKKEEVMIREALDNFQISPYLTENIMRKISHVKPAAPSSNKPLVPWAVAASTLVVVMLILGFGNSKYLARFQDPYSFDATAEMTVDIIDAPLVANLESEPDVRTRVVNGNALDKRNNPEQQSNDISATIAEAQAEEIVENYTRWELPKKAKARFGKGGINVLQFSPDSRQLAASSSIGVWLYDMKTGKEMAMLPGACRSLAFSPDGRFLASAGLWEIATRQQVTLIDAPSRASVSRFSEDGKTFFTLSGNGDSISELDVETGEGSVKHIEGESSYSDYYALTHDKFAVGTGTKIELWDTTTGEMLSTLKGNMRVLALEFSPDGTRLASAGRSSDNTVTLQLWDTESKESILLHKHTGWVNALAFSPNGEMLASGGSDKTVQLWDIATAEPLTTFTGHSSGINALAFSPDNHILASGSADGTVQFWNIKTGNSLPIRITGHTMRVEAAAFFDNTTVATVAHDGVVSLWDVKTSQEIETRTLQITDFYHKGDQDREYQDWLLAAAFSPDGTKIISAGVKGNRLPDSSMAEYTHDRLIRLSDVRMGHELQTLPVAGGASFATFSPDGETVASDVSGNIHVWNTETGETFDISLDMLSIDVSHLDQNDINKIPDNIRSEISAFKPDINALVFSPDGKKLVSGALGGKVEVWDAKTGVSLARVFEGEGALVEGIPPDIMVKYKVFYTYFSICGIIHGIMAYSTDLRKRVLDFIDNGGSKVKAAKLFNISRDVIYKWLNAPDPLAPKKSGPKGPRCIDYKALTQQVKDFPDQTIQERADHFGVSYYCIWYGLRKLGISRKKRHSAIRNDVITSEKLIVNNSLLQRKTENP